MRSRRSAKRVLLSVAALVIAARAVRAEEPPAQPDQAAEQPGQPGQPGTQAQLREFDYGIDAGFGQTDNVNQSQINPISQTMTTANLDFDYKQRTSRLDATAKADFVYYDYLENAYSSQIQGRFDGVANVGVVPGFFNWAFQDDFGEGQVSAFASPTPTNLEQINYFSTGPDFAARLGGTSYLDVSARYANAYYQTSPYGSNRGIATVALGRHLSASASLSLNANTERVYFDNSDEFNNFDRNSVFLNYQVHGSRTDVAVNLGANRINESQTATVPPTPPHRPHEGFETVEDVISTDAVGADALGAGGFVADVASTGSVAAATGPSTFSGVLATLDLSRQISQTSRLTFSVGHILTDSASSFSALQAGALGVVGSAPPAETPNPYTSSYARVSWSYDFKRTTLGLSARWENDVYPDAPGYNVKYTGGQFNIVRKLSQEFTLQLYGSVFNGDYAHYLSEVSEPSTRNDYGTFGAALAWRRGKGLEVRFTYARNALQVTGPGSGYTQNSVFLTIGYRVGKNAGAVNQGVY